MLKTPESQLSHQSGLPPHQTICFEPDSFVNQLAQCLILNLGYCHISQVYVKPMPAGINRW
ncbi:hypothetical protein HanXRQr2_Chr11g0470521 [Helianthus annuus]|uniref:Uncharacterized protein n=1 Tax=Helianthus annuus TaxID=4232 RepID=A0A9K3HKZ7_HELAN|nr:hypothetical protein HanXRQr2_Chr11g0470521 [Helianthus annuus]